MASVAKEFHGTVTPFVAALESENREAARKRTVYRLVQVSSEDDEGLARCRDISDGGAGLRLSIPVHLGERITVKFSPSVSLEGEVVWTNDRDCGVRFFEKIDSDALLAQTAAESRAEGSRPPRLKAQIPAKVIGPDHRTSLATTYDLSQSGIKLSNEGEFNPGLKVRIILPGGRERDGVVRWTQDKIAGLFLTDPFSVEDLGSIRALSTD